MKKYNRYYSSDDAGTKMECATKGCETKISIYSEFDHCSKCREKRQATLLPTCRLVLPRMKGSW